MRLQKMIKDKKIISIIVVSMIGCSAFAIVKNGDYKLKTENISAMELPKVNLHNYYDANNVNLNTLNIKSKNNYQKLIGIKSLLTEEYGNPNKTSDILEQAIFYVDETLNAKKAKFTVRPYSLAEHNTLSKEEVKDIGGIFDCLKEFTEISSKELNLFMDKENVENLEIEYDLRTYAKEDCYGVYCKTNFLKVDEDVIVRFTYKKHSNDSKYTCSYFKLEDDKLQEVSNIPSNIKNELNKLDKVEGNFNIEIKLDTLKEGNFENIGDSNLGYSLESNDNNVDAGIGISFILNTNLYDIFEDTKKVLDRNDIRTTLEMIEAVMNEEFAFSGTKNLYTLKSSGGALTSYIAVKSSSSDSSLKTYSRISDRDYLLEDFSK